jgi:hypothetical protein
MIWASGKALAQTSNAPTSLQFLHLSADPALSPVSVWAGIPVFGSTQFLPVAPNISFRNATPAISNVASPFGPVSVGQFIGQPLSANLTPVSNTTATPTVGDRGAFVGLTLATGANISFVRGVLNPASFAANPNGGDIQLRLSVVADPVTNIPAGVTRLLLYHAVTDAPQIDVVIRQTGQIIVTQLGFDQIVAENLPTSNYILDIYRTSPRTLLASFNAPLQTLGYSGRRVTIAATGFLNPLANQRGPEFGLVAVPNTEGSTEVVLLSSAPPPSPDAQFPRVSLQTIHASADPNLSPIALWLNTMPFGGAQFFPISSNLSFRTATPTRTSLSAGSLNVPLEGNTGKITDALITAVTNGTLPGAALVNVPNYSFNAAANFTLIEGVRDTAAFAPNPSGRRIGVQLRTLPDTVTTLSNTQTRIILAHSVTDAPEVLFDVRDASGNLLGTLGPLTYGLTFVTTNFPVGNYTLSMRPAGTNMELGTFSLNLLSENLGGKRILLTATGFLNRAQNQNGAGVRILATVNDENGRFFLLPGGLVSVRQEQTAQFSSAFRLLPISPNPARETTTLRYELSATNNVAAQIFDARGTLVWSQDLGVQAAGTHSLNIDIAAFAQGAYSVRVSDAFGNAANAKLIVAR